MGYLKIGSIENELGTNGRLLLLTRQPNPNPNNILLLYCHPNLSAKQYLSSVQFRMIAISAHGS